MLRIHKYELEIKDEQTINLPHEYKLLYVGVQKDVIFIWVLLDDTDEKTELTLFRIMGTGRPATIVGNGVGYIGTVMTHDDRLVWHIFKG